MCKNYTTSEIIAHFCKERNFCTHHLPHRRQNRGIHARSSQPVHPFNHCDAMNPTTNGLDIVGCQPCSLHALQANYDTNSTHASVNALYAAARAYVTRFRSASDARPTPRRQTRTCSSCGTLARAQATRQRCFKHRHVSTDRVLAGFDTSPHFWYMLLQENSWL